MASPPPVEMTLPLRSISFTWSPIAPAAAETSGSAFTLVSTDAGNAGVSSVLLFVFLKATLPLITASEFEYESLTTFVNAAVIVSVRT